jgi:hypothetical protein
VVSSPACAAGTPQAKALAVTSVLRLTSKRLKSELLLGMYGFVLDIIFVFLSETLNNTLYREGASRRKPTVGWKTATR